MVGEEEKIFVVTGPGRGHVNPCLELCKHLALRNYHTTLVIPSSTPPLSSAQNPLISLLRIAGPSGPSTIGPGAQDIEAHLSSIVGSARRPLCAVMDFQMGWANTVFWKFDVPVVALFTFGACAAAMEWGAWKARVGGLGLPGHVIPGLPEEMSLKNSDLARRPAHPTRAGGPPKPGDRPPWVSEIEGSIALMFNTCADLERPFIDYVASQTEIPAWGVGPLLPEQYWKPRQSNRSEDGVIQWLDRKPRGSVLYVAFGTEVGPSKEEYPNLARALRESTRPFIWAISEPVISERFDAENGETEEKGLVIRGWAPQLPILSHPSVGGFLSHCGWNSTVEALGRGVPILAWPIRGDQYYNAKFVVDCLEVGYRVSDDFSKVIEREDVEEGIEKLMGDEEMRARATALRRGFERGFPASSARALDDFGEFIKEGIRILGLG